MIFVHGYNVSFQDAMLRAAQLKNDLNFRGAMICYSWPSQGNLLGYLADKEVADWSRNLFEEFLDSIRANTKGSRIFLLAHSMGNRVVLPTIVDMVKQVKNLAFEHVILAAPDFDLFAFKRDVAPILPKTANKTTLYTSKQDKAINLSNSLHRYPRAGGEPDMLADLKNIEVIDASNIGADWLGHSYFAVNDNLLKDISTLLSPELSMNERKLRRKVMQNNKDYIWTLSD